MLLLELVDGPMTLMSMEFPGLGSVVVVIEAGTCEGLLVLDVTVYRKPDPPEDEDELIPETYEGRNFLFV